MKFFVLLASLVVVFGLAMCQEEAVSVEAEGGESESSEPAADAAPGADVLPASTSRLTLKPVTIKAAPILPLPLWHNPAPLVVARTPIVAHAPLIAHAPLVAPAYNWLW